MKMTLDQAAYRLKNIIGYQTMDIKVLSDMFGCSTGRMMDIIDHVQYLNWERFHTRMPKQKTKGTLFV